MGNVANGWEIGTSDVTVEVKDGDLLVSGCLPTAFRSLELSQLAKCTSRSASKFLTCSRVTPEDESLTLDVTSVDESVEVEEKMISLILVTLPRRST